MSRLGQMARSGNLEFTLSSFKCGVEVYEFGEVLDPQGQWCVLHVSIKNAGKKSAFVQDDNVVILDVDGAEYRASTDTLFVEGVFKWESVNPGNTVKGKIFYDVPVGAKLEKVKVKDAFFNTPQYFKLS